MPLYAKTGSQDGYSLMEMLVAILILLPIMAASVGLFKTSADQHSSEQKSVDANQEARAALETMSMEIAQAGSHSDRFTTTTAAIAPSSTEQQVSLTSAEGIIVGDWIDIDMGSSNIETVRVAAVNGNSISCIFLANHPAGSPVALFARPFVTGIIPPAGMTANSVSAQTTLRFYGVLNNGVAGSNPEIHYVEYVYNGANKQITRSATPITQAEKNAAIPFVTEVKINSVQFTLHSDSRGAITSVDIAMTIVSPKSIGNKDEETVLSTKVSIPSIKAASGLLTELLTYGGVNMLPPTPSVVTQWVNNEQ